MTPQDPALISTDRNAFIAIFALFCVATAFGGGGVRYGLANLILQISALLILSVHFGSFKNFCRNAPRSLVILIFATALLPLFQVVPIPAQMWSSLPGREPMLQSFALIGTQNEWAPISLDPARTLVALSGLIAPATVLVVCWSLPLNRLVQTGWLIALLGIINFLIGIPQVLGGAEYGSLYPENPMPEVLFGTFANRNSTGIFLASALAFAALLPTPKPHQLAWLARLGICLLLVVGIVLTRSRTALVLSSLPIVLGVLRAIFFSRFQKVEVGRTRTLHLVYIATSALAVLAIGSTLAGSPSGRIGDALSRFDGTTDTRLYVWEDAAFSVERYWPVGSGMGTFDEVFQIDESLENISERRAGRAHNDYLEVAIEGGLLGLIIIAGWVLLCSILTVRLIHSSNRSTGMAGATVLLVIACQSVFDYPLRNQTMLCVAALALVVLARSYVPSIESGKEGTR